MSPDALMSKVLHTLGPGFHPSTMPADVNSLAEIPIPSVTELIQRESRWSYSGYHFAIQAVLKHAGLMDELMLQDMFTYKLDHYTEEPLSSRDSEDGMRSLYSSPDYVTKVIQNDASFDGGYQHAFTESSLVWDLRQSIGGESIIDLLTANTLQLDGDSRKALEALEQQYSPVAKTNSEITLWPFTIKPLTPPMSPLHRPQFFEDLNMLCCTEIDVGQKAPICASSNVVGNTFGWNGPGTPNDSPQGSGESLKGSLVEHDDLKMDPETFLRLNEDGDRNLEALPEQTSVEAIMNSLYTSSDVKKPTRSEKEVDWMGSPLTCTRSSTPSTLLTCDDLIPSVHNAHNFIANNNVDDVLRTVIGNEHEAQGNRDAFAAEQNAFDYSGIEQGMLYLPVPKIDNSGFATVTEFDSVERLVTHCVPVRKPSSRRRLEFDMVWDPIPVRFSAQSYRDSLNESLIGMSSNCLEEVDDNIYLQLARIKKGCEGTSDIIEHCQAWFDQEETKSSLFLKPRRDEIAASPNPHSKLRNVPETQSKQQPRMLHAPALSNEHGLLDVSFEEESQLNDLDNWLAQLGQEQLPNSTTQATKDVRASKTAPTKASIRRHQQAQSVSPSLTSVGLGDLPDSELDLELDMLSPVMQQPSIAKPVLDDLEFDNQDFDQLSCDHFTFSSLDSGASLPDKSPSDRKTPVVLTPKRRSPLKITNSMDPDCLSRKRKVSNMTKIDVAPSSIDSDDSRSRIQPLEHFNQRENIERFVKLRKLRKS
ncbi:hypothetical protein BZG36_02735 [Bifiguratus adelaidae]|uniref:Uncharacterized protein n=1 Tax=Bifiguratus adelaidae TaxID=1938954 RepID=A0A261XYK9_9FUNG|nr:hypothetical protein BZG36_02735 [Bifiguratus adelaidae]